MDDEKPRKCPRCGNKLYEPFGTRSRREYEVIENPRWSWFFDTSRCLSMSGYLKMKNEFVSYAIPKVQLMLAELTRLVQPSLYVSMLNYTKKRSYAEKIAEVSKATTPSEEPLDQR